jgi:hypothetical protein
MALRIHWLGREITRASYKYIACDYIIYSFAIIAICYVFMFLSYPTRTVSFSSGVFSTHSNVYQASFIAKYSFVAIISALTLSIVIKFRWILWKKYLFTIIYNIMKILSKTMATRNHKDENKYETERIS